MALVRGGTARHPPSCSGRPAAGPTIHVHTASGSVELTSRVSSALSLHLTRVPVVSGQEHAATLRPPMQDIVTLVSGNLSNSREKTQRY